MDGISLWRAEFVGNKVPTCLTTLCRWLSPRALPRRKQWYRPHFEVLTHLGVRGSGQASAIFPTSHGPSLGDQALHTLSTQDPLGALPPVSALLHDNRAATPDDSFLGDVLQAVLD